MYRPWCYLALLASVLVFSDQATSNSTFPADFKIGVASSAYQIEGGWNASGKGVNIWDKYVHERPYIIDRSTGDVSANSYYNYKDDVAAAKKLSVNFYRFSVSWSRILPTGHVHMVNQAGVDYYNNLINELRTNGIEPMIAMYHWDLPQPLQDLGGWANPVMADYFEDYCRVLYSKFGDRVKSWITIVDPHSIAYGYAEPESYAPGVNSSGIGYYMAAHTLIQAHARAYQVHDKEFKKTQNGKVGIALNGEWYEPATNSSEDKQAAELAMQFVFGLFANPIYSSKGDYPQDVRMQVDKLSAAEGYSRSRLRKFFPREIAAIKGTFDFIGLNYYTSRMAKAPKPTADVKNVPDINVIFNEIPNWPNSTAPFYEVVPWGFRKLLNWIKNTYNNVPVMITENGFADRGGTEDTERSKFMVSHMSEMLKAIGEDNCNVIGYTFWSLLDGFEWDLGYTMKFGLFNVNFSDPTRQRVEKKSAYVFSEIARKRELPEYYMQITGEAPAPPQGVSQQQPGVPTGGDHAHLNQSTTQKPSSASSVRFNYSGTLLYAWLAILIYIYTS